jgi:hypothetical protein
MGDSPHQAAPIDGSRPLWRCIYIAKDHNGEMLGMILAPSYAIAQAYFTGTGLSPHSLEVIDPCDQTIGDPFSGIGVIARGEAVEAERFGPKTWKLVR